MPTIKSEFNSLKASMNVQISKCQVFDDQILERSSKSLESISLKEHKSVFLKSYLEFKDQKINSSIFSEVLLPQQKKSADLRVKNLEQELEAQK